MGKKKYRSTASTKQNQTVSSGAPIEKDTVAEKQPQNSTPKKNKSKNDFGGEIVLPSQLKTRRNATAWERTAQAFACIMFLVFPLLIGPGKYTNITETKYYWFIGLTVAYLVLVIALFFAYFAKDKWFRERKAEGWQKLNAIQIVIIVYMVWAVISAIASGHGLCHDTIIGQSRFEALLSIWLYGITFILMAFWGEFTEKYSYAIAIMAVILGFIAFLQTCGSPMIYPEGYNYWGIQFLSTIGNVDCVSGIIAMFVPVLATSFVVLDNKWRWLMIPGVIILIYVQSIMGVDSGKLGLIAAAIMTLPFLVDSKKKASRTALIYAIIAATFGIQRWTNMTQEGFQPTMGKLTAICFVIAVVLAAASALLSKKQGEFNIEPKTIRRTVAIAMLVVIIVAFVCVYGYHGDNRILYDASEVLHGRLADEAGSYRGYIYKSTVEVIKNYGLIGVGPGCFYEGFSPYNAGWQQYFPSQVVDYAHCDLLQIGACEGIIGLLIYLVFVGMLVYTAIKNSSRCPAVLILAAGCAGFLVHTWFGFSIAIVSPPFWVMAGLMVKCARQIPEQKKAKETKEEK